MRIEDGKVIPEDGDFKIPPVSDFKPSKIQGANELEFEVFGLRNFLKEQIQKAQNMLNEQISVKYLCNPEELVWISREDLETIIVFLKGQAIGQVKARQFFDSVYLNSKIALDFIPFTVI